MATELDNTATDNSDNLVNLSVLETRAVEFAERYRTAEPYGHIVIDDVLAPATLAAVYSELAEMQSESWNSYHHLNERKFSHTDMAQWGPTTRAVTDVLAGDRFVSFLETVTGFAGLHADLTLDGGGLHRCYRGGFLNIHADFTAHHRIPNWRRRVNLLLYLNPTWDEAWGGDLELWDPTMSHRVSSVAPLGNRILLFSTDELSFHGHPEPLTAPDGVARQSLALYYFTEEAQPLTKATDYRPRPEDGRRGLLIRADSRVLAGYDAIKRRFGLSDRSVRRIMGWFARRSN